MQDAASQRTEQFGTIQGGFIWRFLLCQPECRYKRNIALLKITEMSNITILNPVSFHETRKAAVSACPGFNLNRDYLISALIRKIHLGFVFGVPIKDAVNLFFLLIKPVYTMFSSKTPMSVLDVEALKSPII